MSCEKCTHCKIIASELKRREKSERGTTALYAPSHADRLTALAAMHPQEVNEWFHDLSIADATTVIAAAPDTDREAMLERLAPNVIDTARVYARADMLPERVRLTSESVSFAAQPITIDHATAVRLEKAGLEVAHTDEQVELETEELRNRRKRQASGGGDFKYVRRWHFTPPIEVHRGMRSCVVTRAQFDLCIELDRNLAQLIKHNAICVAEMDRDQNVAHELALLELKRRGDNSISRQYRQGSEVMATHNGIQVFR